MDVNGKISSLFSTEKCDQLDWVIQAVFFLMMASFSLLCISELAERSNYLNYLNNKITSLKSDYVNREKPQTIINQDTSSDNKNNILEKNDNLLIKKNIRKYEILRERLNALIMVGALNNSDDVLLRISHDFKKIESGEKTLIGSNEINKEILRFKEHNKKLKERNRQLIKEKADLKDRQFVIDSERDYKIDLLEKEVETNNEDIEKINLTIEKLKVKKDKLYYSLLHIFNENDFKTFFGIGLFANHYLLAIAIITCGGIGSLISNLRDDLKMSIKTIVLGLATGFIVYLGLSGGKQIFILESKKNLLTFNPYSTALVGLLAGLFSHKVYGFLSKLVSKGMNWLERSLINN